MRKQKVGREDSATRSALLDAAEQMMREEGYAAVTSRRVAAKALVRAQLVHYYFPTMDDLFLALFRRRAQTGLPLMAKALEDGRVFQVLWQQNTDRANATMNLEFMALANHRKSLRTEFAKFGEELRRLQHQALLRHFKTSGVNPEIDPRVMTFLFASAGILLALESEAGISFGHAKVRAAVKSMLKRVSTTGSVPEAAADNALRTKGRSKRRGKSGSATAVD